jgi:hypothetical protein
VAGGRHVAHRAFAQILDAAPLVTSKGTYDIPARISATGHAARRRADPLGGEDAKGIIVEAILRRGLGAVDTVTGGETANAPLAQLSVLAPLVAAGVNALAAGAVA